MPRCICPSCRASADGRWDEWARWAVLGEACTHDWRRIRTFRHSFDGEMECRLCYERVG